MSAFKVAVAGAARALWLSDLGPSLSLQTLLKTEPGTRITWRQACMVIGEPLSPLELAMLSMSRRAVADAAQLLVDSRGTTCAWLRNASPGRIVECAKHAHDADINVAAFREQHGSRVIAAPGWSLDESRDSRVADAAWWLFQHCGSRIQSLRPWSGKLIIEVYERNLADAKDRNERRSEVADAAQWLFLNRNCASGKVAGWDREFILRAYAIARGHDEMFEEEKKYSLSDLRRAYDMGHAQGSLGENGFNNEWRDAALKEI